MLLDAEKVLSDEELPDIKEIKNFEEKVVG
jgi:hypothetical protein